MLDWVIEKILAVLALIPALFVEERSPNVFMVRAMFALMLIVAIVYAATMWPPRGTLGQYVGKIMNLFTQKR
jgi:hypothetical protein